MLSKKNHELGVDLRLTLMPHRGAMNSFVLLGWD